MLHTGKEKHPVSLQHEPIGSHLVVQVTLPKILSWRRFKVFALLGAFLLTLTFTWIYRGFVIHRAEDYARDLYIYASYDNACNGTPQPLVAQESPKSSYWDTARNNGYPIPSKIWQIVLAKKEPGVESTAIDEASLQDSASWLAKNPDYAYTLVGDNGGWQFVQKHYSGHKELLSAYNSLQNVGMKSDLLRYLLLSVEGGVYTDTDTVALKPIDKWVSQDIRSKVRLVVGIEFDRGDDDMWADIAYSVQFCQWTIAAAPGHPAFMRMADRILHSLKDLTAEHQVPIELLKPTSFEVMNSTGPAAFTDVVFKLLQEHDPTLKDTDDLRFMREPTLFGDILVLPIDGFGMGQDHSNSTSDGTIPEAALMMHHFRGSWRDEGMPAESEEEPSQEQPEESGEEAENNSEEDSEEMPEENSQKKLEEMQKEKLEEQPKKELEEEAEDEPEGNSEEI